MAKVVALEQRRPPREAAGDFASSGERRDQPRLAALARDVDNGCLG